MKTVARTMSGPAVFVGLVAVAVCLAALLLWRAMRSEPGNPAVRPPGTVHREAIVRDQAQVVALVLRDMRDMAYEHDRVTMDEAVRQTDFAVLQALQRSGVPSGSVSVRTETRAWTDGEYPFHQMAFAPAVAREAFLETLRESLGVWSEGATLDGRDPLWTVEIKGVVTHELVFSRPRTDDTPSSRPRIVPRRQPGEAARMVIVMDDLGESLAALNTLLHLPFPVTCAVWPHSTHARKSAERAHAFGREVIIHQPAEPMKYPEMQPGPRPLLVSLPQREIEARVLESLKRVPHATGMNNHMGSRFTRDRRAASAMVRPLKPFGFFVLDSMTHPASILHEEAAAAGIPALRRDIFLDTVPYRDHVLGQLRKAENIALATGTSIAIGHPLPETLAALREWEGRRNAQVDLVRLSDLLSPPSDR